MNRRSFALVAALAALAAACERGESSAVDPVWGKVPCSHCAMLVGERATAAQALDAAGDRLFFDDAGCLVAWMDEHRGNVRAAWVHQGEAGPWVPAAEARFAPARTPMDFGFVAAGSGGSLSFDELHTHVLAKLSAGGAR
jgi:hypothetical protein